MFLQLTVQISASWSCSSTCLLEPVPWREEGLPPSPLSCGPCSQCSPAAACLCCDPAHVPSSGKPPAYLVCLRLLCSLRYKSTHKSCVDLCTLVNSHCRAIKFRKETRKIHLLILLFWKENSVGKGDWQRQRETGIWKTGNCLDFDGNRELAWTLGLVAAHSSEWHLPLGGGKSLEGPAGWGGEDPNAGSTLDWIRAYCL